MDNNGSGLSWREVNYRNSRVSRARRGQPNSRVSSNNQVRSSSFHNYKTNRPTLNAHSRTRQMPVVANSNVKVGSSLEKVSTMVENVVIPSKTILGLVK